MLTILSWFIFIPALFWNIIFFSVIFGDLIVDGKFDLNNENFRQLVISLSVLFIPGVYLFGLF